MWKQLIRKVTIISTVTLLTGCRSASYSLESQIPEEDYKTKVSIVALIESFGDGAFHADGIDMDGNWFSSTSDIITLKIIKPKEFEGHILSVHREHPHPFQEQWRNEGSIVSFVIPLAYLKSPYEWPGGGSTEIYTDLNGDIELVEFEKTHIQSANTNPSCDGSS